MQMVIKPSADILINKKAAHDPGRSNGSNTI